MASTLLLAQKEITHGKKFYKTDDSSLKEWTKKQVEELGFVLRKQGKHMKTSSFYIYRLLRPWAQSSTEKKLQIGSNTVPAASIFFIPKSCNSNIQRTLSIP